MIHRYALACKTLSDPLQEVLDSVIAIVNYVKSSALNTRLFKELCKDMDSDHECLLYYTAVRWLSEGKVLSHVVKMKDERKLFMEVQGKTNFVAQFEDDAWVQRLSYLPLFDIFDKLN